jgi:hypothetical protein
MTLLEEWLAGDPERQRLFDEAKAQIEAEEAALARKVWILEAYHSTYLVGVFSTEAKARAAYDACMKQGNSAHSLYLFEATIDEVDMP